MVTTEKPTEGKTIVVAVDNSSVAEGALKWAARSMVGPNDRLHIVTVVRPQPVAAATDEDPTDPWMPPNKAEVKAADELLEHFKEHLSKTQVSQLTTASVIAEVGSTDGIGQALREYTLQANADAVVVGHRGLGSISKSLLGIVGLGSVSEYCVNHVPCNVVVHKEPPQPQSKPVTHAKLFENGVPAVDDYLCA